MTWTLASLPVSMRGGRGQTLADGLGPNVEMVSVTEAQEREEQRRHSPRHSDGASRLLAKAAVQREWKKTWGALGGLRRS